MPVVSIGETRKLGFLPFDPTCLPSAHSADLQISSVQCFWLGIIKHHYVSGIRLSEGNERIKDIMYSYGGRNMWTNTCINLRSMGALIKTMGVLRGKK